MVLELVFGDAVDPERGAGGIPAYCEDMDAALRVHKHVLADYNRDMRYNYIEAFMQIAGINERCDGYCAVSAVFDYLNPLSICQAALCARIMSWEWEDEDK